MGSKHDNLVLRNTESCEKPITMLNHTIATLTTVCQHLPVGTNLAMVHFQWMLISGALLPNRGLSNYLRVLIGESFSTK